MITAADVYTSGTFWLTALIVVLTMVLLGFTAVSLRRQFPRRRVTWSFGASVSVIEPAVGPQLEVYLKEPDHGGDQTRRKLASPHFTSVSMKNDGRVDIGTASFDADTPIKLLLGDNVDSANLLSVEGPRSFPVALDGTTLTFGPGHLKKRSLVQARLLVDGNPNFTLESSLLDWPERTAAPESQSPSAPPPGVFLAGITTSVVVMALVFAWFIYRSDSSTISTMPDVRTLSATDASAELKTFGFSHIEVDSVASTSKPTGTVIAQYPSVGAPLFKNQHNHPIADSATIIVVK